MLHVQGHLLQSYTGSFASMLWRIPLFPNVSQKRILRFLIDIYHYYSSWVVQKSRWCKTCEAEIFIQKFDSHFAMFSWLEVERFLYLIKALGVGIRLDWGRQISAHVFINRTQSSLSFMRLEWRGNSRLAVESSPLRLTFLSQRVGKSWECQGGYYFIFNQCVRWMKQMDTNCLCLLSLWSATMGRHTGKYLLETNLWRQVWSLKGTCLTNMNFISSCDVIICLSPWIPQLRDFIAISRTINRIAHIIDALKMNFVTWK